jgi:regulator of replication initiation timing
MFHAKTDEIFDFLEEIDDKMHDMHDEIKELRKRLDRILALLDIPQQRMKN